MRPTRFFSAALCGVLYTSSIPFANAQAENCRLFGLCSVRDPCELNPLGCAPTSSPGTPVSLNIPTSQSTPAPPNLDPPTPSVESTVLRASTIPVPTHTAFDVPITYPANSPPRGSSGGGGNGAIIGGVIGGLLGVALILGAVFLWRRRRHQGAAAAGDFGALEKSLPPPPTVYPVPITAYSPPPPATQLSQAPPVTAVESHHLMGSYSSPSHQHYGGGVVPVVGGANYAANNERELDDDGVSLRSPSPVQDGGRAGERDSVPRLPIYNRGADNAERGPAL